MGSMELLSNDRLADEIVTLAGRLAAGEARLLLLVAEFDRREAWGGPGLLSCAHWLSWRIGLSPGAARERVRVARALDELPVVRESFTAGRLSWSQVRAITRVATPANEASLVELARHSTAAQPEKVVRGLRRVDKIAQDEADPERAAWKLRVKTIYDDDGNLTITVKVPAQDGAVVLAALHSAQAEVDLERRRGAAAAYADPDADADTDGLPLDVPAGTPDPAVAPELEPDVPAGTPQPARATLADALLHLTGSYLAQQATDRPAAARRQRAALVIHLDPLSGWARLPDGEWLPPGTVRLTLPTIPGSRRTPVQIRLRPATTTDRTACDLGRTQRLPSRALRELLAALDGERCRFPGCTRTCRLHAHHVHLWSAGGATDLDNLVLLCTHHHTLVHSTGFHLALTPHRTLTITTADGTAVPHLPVLPWADADQLDTSQLNTDQAGSGDTLTPLSFTPRMDLGHVVAVMLQHAA